MLSAVFRRSIRPGWLVISGPIPTIEDRGIARLYDVIDRSRPAVLLKPDIELQFDQETWIDDLASLLELEFTSVDPEGLSDLELLSYLRQTGLLLAIGGEESTWSDLLETKIRPLLDEEEVNPDLVQWYVGAASRVLGRWRYDAELEETAFGLDWLPGCLILQEKHEASALKAVQAVLLGEERSYALNLGNGSSLALGPQGEVDLWGTPPPAILLGKGWGEA